jgi:hypothetical protein
MGYSGMPRIDQPERPRPPPPLQARNPRRTYKWPRTPTGPSTHIIVYPWKPMKVGQSINHVQESPASDSNPQRHKRPFLNEPSNWLPLHQVKIRRDPQTPLLVGFVASTEYNFAVAACTCRMKKLPAITNFRRSFQSTSSEPMRMLSTTSLQRQQWNLPVMPISRHKDMWCLQHHTRNLTIHSTHTSRPYA